MSVSALPGQRPLAAAGSVVAAMALLGLIDNLIFLVAGVAGLWQFHLVRSLIAVPVIVAVARATGRRVWPLRPWAVAARSFLVGASMLLYFGSLAFLSVGQAAAGLFTAPIFVLLISVLALRQRVGPRRIAAALVGFTGILLVLRPETGALSVVASMPLAAGLFYAFGAHATRHYCAEEGTLALLAGFFAMMAVLGALGCVVLEVIQPQVPDGPDGFLLRGWTPVGAAFLGLTATHAFGAVLGVGLITRGYLLAEAPYVAVFEYALLIFAAAWGWILWRQIPDPLAVAGFALIIGSGALLVRAMR